jgi:hypothetical protein
MTGEVEEDGLRVGFGGRRPHLFPTRVEEGGSSSEQITGDRGSPRQSHGNRHQGRSTFFAFFPKMDAPTILKLLIES